jgi:hypothetical protein
MASEMDIYILNELFHHGAPIGVDQQFSVNTVESEKIIY